MQVIPLYTDVNEGAFDYFKNHQSEINTITGQDLVIALPETVRKGDAEDVYSNGPGTKRYPGLKKDDLPCLWVEDSSSRHEIIPLPKAKEDIQKLLAQLAQAGHNANSVQELVKGTKEKSAIVSRNEAQFYLKVAILAFVAFLILVAILIPCLPRLRMFGSAVLTVGCYGVLGIVMAVALFGILRSFGYIKSAENGTVGANRVGVAWEFGGPAALAVFVLLVGLAYEAWINKSTFGVLVNTYDATASNTLIKATGNLTLHTKDQRTFPINAGSVYLNELQSSAKGASVDYDVEVQGYKKSRPEQLTLDAVNVVRIYLEKSQEMLQLQTSRPIVDDIVSQIKFVTDEIAKTYNKQIILHISTNIPSDALTNRIAIEWHGVNASIPAQLAFVEAEFNRTHPKSQIAIYVAEKGVWIGAAEEKCPEKGYEHVHP